MTDLARARRRWTLAGASERTERFRATGLALCAAVGAVGAGAVAGGVAAWESYRDAMPCEDGAENCALQVVAGAVLGAVIAFVVLGALCGAIAGTWRLGPTGLLAGLLAAATGACLVGFAAGSMSEPSVVPTQLAVLVVAFVVGYMVGHGVARAHDTGPVTWSGPGRDGGGAADDGTSGGPGWPTPR